MTLRGAFPLFARATAAMWNGHWKTIVRGKLSVAGCTCKV